MASRHIFTISVLRPRDMDRLAVLRTSRSAGHRLPAVRGQCQKTRKPCEGGMTEPVTFLDGRSRADGFADYCSVSKTWEAKRPFLNDWLRAKGLVA